MRLLAPPMWASLLSVRAESSLSIAVDSLVAPDEIAQQHSRQLQAILKQRMAGSMISFSEYMQQVLYEPGLGYYMAGAQKFGEKGDFVTAPELGPLFGQCLAEACRSSFKSLPASILELGAGSGRLAASVIADLNDINGLDYYILEPSAELQARQRSFLQSTLSSAQYDSVNWLTSLPQAFSGVVIANEVMDAMPVERVQLGEQARQMCVRIDGDQFISESRKAPAQLQAECIRLLTSLDHTLPDVYHTEVATMLAPWLAALSQAVETATVLLIDYGYPRQEYYAAERVDGTLACYYQHHMHDYVFWWPGLQDLTAHVDFTRVIESASNVGFELLGYTSQAMFLLDNGLTDKLQELTTACTSEVEQLALAQQAKKLTLPGEMGERFQVMALGKRVDDPPTGFSMQELSYRL